MSEWVNEWVGKWVNEWVGEWVSEWVSEWSWMNDKSEIWQRNSNLYYTKLSTGRIHNKSGNKWVSAKFQVYQAASQQPQLKQQKHQEKKQFHSPH